MSGKDSSFDSFFIHSIGPNAMYCWYKYTNIYADLLPDGNLLYDGELFDSPSLCVTQMKKNIGKNNCTSRGTVACSFHERVLTWTNEIALKVDPGWGTLSVAATGTILREVRDRWLKAKRIRISPRYGRSNTSKSMDNSSTSTTPTGDVVEDTKSSNVVSKEEEEETTTPPVIAATTKKRKSTGHLIQDKSARTDSPSIRQSSRKRPNSLSGSSSSSIVTKPKLTVKIKTAASTASSDSHENQSKAPERETETSEHVVQEVVQAAAPSVSTTKSKGKKRRKQCSICTDTENDATEPIIACNVCSKKFHWKCLVPALTELPSSGQFFCSKCRLGLVRT